MCTPATFKIMPMHRSIQRRRRQQMTCVADAAARAARACSRCTSVTSTERAAGSTARVARARTCQAPPQAAPLERAKHRHSQQGSLDASGADAAGVATALPHAPLPIAVCNLHGCSQNNVFTKMSISGCVRAAATALRIVCNWPNKQARPDFMPHLSMTITKSLLSLSTICKYLRHVSTRRTVFN